MSSYKVISVEDRGRRQQMSVFDVDRAEEPIVVLDLGEKGNTDEEKIHTFPEELDHRKDTFVLALPSEWCLSSTVSLENVPASARRKCIPYLLEEQLPIEAESFCFGARHYGPNNTAIGVCCEREQLEAVVRVLKGRKIAVEHIVPSALLAMGSLIGRGGQENSLYLLGNANSCDLFVVEDNRLLRWVFCRTEGLLESHLRYYSLISETALNVTLIGDHRDKWKEVVDRVDGLALDEKRDVSLREEISIASKKILRGEWKPIVDLGDSNGRDLVERKGERRLIGWLAAAIMALIVSLNIFFMVRAREYRDLEESYRLEATKLFYEVFPGEKRPSDMRLFVQEELDRLEKASLRSRSAWRTPGVFRVLCGVLLGLPSDVRYSISEVGVDNNFVRIKGEVRSPGDADRIMKGTTKCGLTRMEIPQTTRLDDKRVKFVMRGAVCDEN